MMRTIFYALISALALSACVGTTPTSATQTDEKVGTSSKAEETSVADTSLPAQTLAPNECGLFLWSKTNTSRFVFFTRAGEKSALFMLDETPTQLQTVSESGEIFGQFFTQIIYQTDNGQEISLSYKPGKLLQEGARISNGIVEFSNELGWRTVMPVVGVRGCQPPVSDAPLRQPVGAQP